MGQRPGQANDPGFRSDDVRTVFCAAALSLAVCFAGNGCKDSGRPDSSSPTSSHETSNETIVMLRHGENALTYPPGDSDALATRLQELQSNPEQRCQMVEAAQQEVLSKYNETTVTDRIENYLQTSLEVWAHTAS